MRNKMKKAYYTASEWQSRIAGFGRLVDIRNFPDIAGKVLLGEHETYLGRGVHLPKKNLDPEMIPAVVFWTKGPVETLVKNKHLLRTLKVYRANKAVVGIQLSVTGLGGTLLEPGIPSVDESVSGLDKLLQTGLIDPEAITLRYDPIIKARCPENQLISNASHSLFEKVIIPFAKLGVRRVQTKFLLFSQIEGGKYHHVYKKMQQLGITPLSISDSEKFEILSRFKELSNYRGLECSTCCIAQEQQLPSWSGDNACLSADHLTRVGKRLFGNQWNRITQEKRSSRKGCLCTAYWDLSYVKGHKKCGSQSPACLYCSASSHTFGKSISAFCH